MKKFKNVFFAHKKLENHLKKLHTYGSWSVFFSAAWLPRTSFPFYELFYTIVSAKVSAAIQTAIFIYVFKYVQQMYNQNKFFLRKSRLVLNNSSIYWFWQNTLCSWCCGLGTRSLQVSLGWKPSRRQRCTWAKWIWTRITSQLALIIHHQV